MGPDIPEGCPDCPGGGADYPFGMMASDKLGLATTTDLNREKHRANFNKKHEKLSIMLPMGGPERS